MHERTGELLSLEDVYKLPKREQKSFVEIANEYLPMLEGMNRHERRKWLKQNRHLVRRFNNDSHLKS